MLRRLKPIPGLTIGPKFGDGVDASGWLADHHRGSTYVRRYFIPVQAGVRPGTSEAIREVLVLGNLWYKTVR